MASLNNLQQARIIDTDVTELLEILAAVLQRSADWICRTSKSFSDEEPWKSHDKWWFLGKGFGKLQVLQKWPSRWTSSDAVWVSSKQVWAVGNDTQRQELRLNFWPAWSPKNLWPLVQELTPANWTRIPAWVIPFCLSKIPHLFQTCNTFSLPPLKTAKQFCMFCWALCCVLPHRQLKPPVNDPLQSFAAFYTTWSVYSYTEQLSIFIQSCGL